MSHVCTDGFTADSRLCYARIARIANPSTAILAATTCCRSPRQTAQRDVPWCYKIDIRRFETYISGAVCDMPKWDWNAMNLFPQPYGQANLKNHPRFFCQELKNILQDRAQKNVRISLIQLRPSPEMVRTQTTRAAAMVQLVLEVGCCIAFIFKHMSQQKNLFPRVFVKVFLSMCIYIYTSPGHQQVRTEW